MRTDRSLVTSPVRRVGVAGITSGLLLGALLLLVHAVSGYPLDRVLLDLSYVPGLRHANVPWIQWTAHLLTSTIAATLYAGFTRRFTHYRYPTGMLFGALLSLSYFPLVRLTAPALQGHWQPFLLWLLAHILYGATLVALLQPHSGGRQ